MKPVLMIHEISDSLFDLPLVNYTLTFDDGLFGHYHFYHKFADIDTEKIFFISSNIVCNGQQSYEFPDSGTAHHKAMIGNYEDYMTIDQIKELSKEPNVYIGGHSHAHFDVNHLSLQRKIEYLKNDTEEMLEWFEHNLHIRPTKFCYPYNETYHGIYSAILRPYGFTEFYGSERIDVACLFASQM